MLFKIAVRKKLEGLIDDLARSYLLDDPTNSEQGRAEICRRITEVAGELRSAGHTKTIAEARAYHPEIEIVLPREVRRHMQYLVARALS
jgi:adenylylsulfate kinase-like enzyme